MKFDSLQVLTIYIKLTQQNKQNKDKPNQRVEMCIPKNVNTTKTAGFKFKRIMAFYEKIQYISV